MLINRDEAIAAIQGMIEGDTKENEFDAGYHDCAADAVEALRALPTVSVTARCGTCHYCLMQNWDGKGFPPTATRMVLCTDCGNKRCPKAANCWNVCTGSNEPGQIATVSDGWEDIATLPDFTDALVCVTYNVPAEENDQRPPTDVEGYVWETVQWVDCRIGDKGWFAFPHLIHVPFPPTKWRPLPAPPTIELG